LRNNGDQEDYNDPKFISFSECTKTSCRIQFAIDEPIVELPYYRPILDRIKAASEDDLIEVTLSTPGGIISTATTIIDALNETPAKVHIHLTGEIFSAGTLILLGVPKASITAAKFSFVGFHTAGVGFGGQLNHVENRYDFEKNRIYNIFDEIYADFLTPKEIAAIKDGKELYMDVPEVFERLEKRYKAKEKAFKAYEKGLTKT
jgi:ClpP class serine protease